MTLLRALSVAGCLYSSQSSSFLFSPRRQGLSSHQHKPDNLLSDNREVDEPAFTAYSRDLLREKVNQEANEYQIIDSNEPVRWWKRPFQSVQQRIRGAREPGKLILLRSGQSTWNAQGIFSGWGDPELTLRGIQECQHAAQLLITEGYEPDIVYTSQLKRSIQSARIVLEEIDALFLPLYKSWRLNERSYGALTGLKKREVASEFGTQVVQAWRNTLKARPPLLSSTIPKDDPRDPRNDPRYKDVPTEDIPLGESLTDTMARTCPLWSYRIRKDLARGDNVLVVAHGNTLRGLMREIDDITDTDIQDITVPAGIPLVYRFDQCHTMCPVSPQSNKESLLHTNATFLEKPSLLVDALKQQNEWKATVPGLKPSETQMVNVNIRRTANLQDSVWAVRQQQNGDAGGDPGTLQQHERWEDDPCEFEEYDEFFSDFADENTDLQVNLEPVPHANVEQHEKDPVVVFLRHGRTPHNNLALFTGWEDPPLALEGIEDAKSAGRTLRLHGFEFDCVYASWLTRAIQTALYVLDEMDCVWVPMIKSWRLNERMYGALTGKSKAMIANEYGEDQLKKWRRGFKIQPPKVSSYSPSYPGNDQRRTRYVKDLPISWSETLNRSIEQRKLQIHRRFPKAESLHDCMSRSIPFYTERIVNEAVSKGKRVLIASHENAIRGILMHLCDIPEEAMNQLHLPNGLPLVYNVRRKCIQLLDDGSGQDPMEMHDFGPAAKYLFQQECEL